MQSNATCSDDLRSATTLVWSTINELRAKHPGISEMDILLNMSKSYLILYDIPTVTNNCMVQMIPESTVVTAYKTRETIRKTFGVMINDLTKDGTSDNGTTIAVKHSTYVRTRNTICGPTQFMGEIDGGEDDATLGLHAMKHAFQNTTSSWRRKGDGQVIVNFQRQDTKDVVVNIRSGGDKIGEVKVKAGGTAHFVSTVKQIGGKTLFFDRWRPGFLGLPRTGGGTLTLWVPISPQRPVERWLDQLLV
ncbi:hypothetical protein PsorP6_019417 [Peronosclerospora sorghi]|nr:hypothetical protein PsorP6_019417 [Peronosclerospora sorghi]